MRMGVGAGIGELVKHARRNVDRLAGVDRHAFLAEAHFAGALHDEVDLLLLLVVPGHLAAIGLERDVPEGKVGGLDGAGAAHQVLRAAPRRVRAAGNGGKIGDDHGFRKRPPTK